MSVKGPFVTFRPDDLLFLGPFDFEAGVNSPPSGMVTESGSPVYNDSASPSPLLGSYSLRTAGASVVNINFANQTTVELFAMIQRGGSTTADFPIGLANGSTNCAYVNLLTNGAAVAPTLSCGTKSAATVSTWTSGVTYYCWFRYVQGANGGNFASFEFSTTPTRLGSGNGYVSISNGDANLPANFAQFASFTSGEFWIFDHIIVSSSSIPSNP